MALLRSSDSHPLAWWLRRWRPLACLIWVFAWIASVNADPAAAARPVKGAHYYGFEGADVPAVDFTENTALLSVSATGHRFSRRGAGSYVHVAIGCKADRDGSVEGTIRLASRRRQAPIGRKGGFSLAGRQGRLRFRLRGHFVASDEARIVYRARRPPRRPRHPRHPGLCNGTGVVTLYRDGQPPFRGCRTQRATTLVRGNSGRIFEQERRTGQGGFFPHVYACLFETNKRVLLDQNWDDERVEVPKLAGRFAGYSQVGCADVAGCFSAIRVKDVSTGGTVGYGSALCEHPATWQSEQTNRLGDLELRDNGSVGWTIAVAGSQSTPGSKAYREVCAADPGRRQLDVGDGIDLKSLRLQGSTLTWVKDGVTRSATLH